MIITIDTYGFTLLPSEGVKILFNGKYVAVIWII